jgi:hypothetical protein
MPTKLIKFLLFKIFFGIVLEEYGILIRNKILSNKKKEELAALLQ